jgi:hypothetical protein
VQSTEATLREHLDAQEQHLTELSERLSTGKQQLLEAVRERLETELGQATAAAVQGVEDSLALLGQTASRAQQVASAAREGLESRFEALNEAMEPMPAAIDSVKQAAQEAGLPWR